MSAEIINLATIRADRRDQAEKREEAFLRQEASGFSESLQATVERSRLNLPMMATLYFMDRHPGSEMVPRQAEIASHGCGRDGFRPIVVVRPELEQAHILQHLEHLRIGRAEAGFVAAVLDFAEHRHEGSNEFRSEIVHLFQVDHQMLTARLDHLTPNGVRFGMQILVTKSVSVTARCDDDDFTRLFNVEDLQVVEHEMASPGREPILTGHNLVRSIAVRGRVPATK